MLGDKSANGPPKKRMKFFPAARNSSTATKKERGAIAAQRNKTNSGEAAKELHEALRKLVDDYGRASKEDMEKSVLGIGAVLPQALANVEGGERIPAVLSVVVLNSLTSTKVYQTSSVCCRAKS